LDDADNLFKCLELRSAGKFILLISPVFATQGEEGQPQQFLVRATFSSFSCPSHLENLILCFLCVFKFLNLENNAFFDKKEIAKYLAYLCWPSSPCYTVNREYQV